MDIETPATATPTTDVRVLDLTLVACRTSADIDVDRAIERAAAGGPGPGDDDDDDESGGGGDGGNIDPDDDDERHDDDEDDDDEEPLQVLPRG